MGQRRHFRARLGRRSRSDVWQAGIGVANEVLDKLKADESHQGSRRSSRPSLDQAVRPRLRGHRHLDRRGRFGPAGRGAQRHGLLAAQPAHDRRRRDARRRRCADRSRQLGGHSAAYVCPKGFDGTYRMLVRRVWGNVTAGKVNVEVITHYQHRRGPWTFPRRSRWTRTRPWWSST